MMVHSWGALAYLEDQWPIAAELLDAVYQGNIPAEEISEKIKAVRADAKVKRDRQFEPTLLDAATVNPEQAMVKILETLARSLSNASIAIRYIGI